MSRGIPSIMIGDIVTGVVPLVVWITAIRENTMDTTHESSVSAPPVQTTRQQTVRWGRWLVYVGLAALFIFLALGLLQAYKGPVETGKAPDFTLTSFDGSTVTLSKLRGQVVVVNFWASWCVPCRDEAPYLERTWRKYRDRGVVFIGVDYVDTEKGALAFIKEFDITYLNGPDIGTRISDAYHIKGVPETYFVAKNGDLRGNVIGPLASPQLDSKIETLLAEDYHP
jgi:cytochrome c biogenesis protein CcmG/thiol:disulfide interchange protein DsbE